MRDSISLLSITITMNSTMAQQLALWPHSGKDHCVQFSCSCALLGLTQSIDALMKSLFLTTCNQ